MASIVRFPKKSIKPAKKKCTKNTKFQYTNTLIAIISYYVI